VRVTKTIFRSRKERGALGFLWDVIRHLWLGTPIALMKAPLKITCDCGATVFELRDERANDAREAAK